MPYNPTNWNDGGPPAINAANLNKIEQALDGVVDLAEAAAPASHNHDARYYTETEVDAALSGKANASALPEVVRDTMSAALVAGDGITITPDDPGDTITIAATGGGGGGVDVPWPSLLMPGKKTWLTQRRNTVTVPSGLAIPVPLGIMDDCTIDGASFFVDYAPSSDFEAELGVYAADGPSGTPGTLVASLGTIPPTGTGRKDLTFSQALTRGQYWMVLLVEGTSIRLMDSTSTFTGRVGGTLNFGDKVNLGYFAYSPLTSLPATLSPTTLVDFENPVLLAVGRAS